MSRREAARRGGFHETPRRACHDDFAAGKPVPLGDGDETRVRTRESFVYWMNRRQRICEGEGGLRRGQGRGG